MDTVVRALTAGGRHHFFHFVDRGFELARRERLEDDRGLAGRHDLVLGLERDVGRGDREQPIRGRPLDLVAAGEDVAQAHCA